MRCTDTIVALATPPGQGAVSVVRVSGPAVVQVARMLLGELPRPRYAKYCAFRDPAGRLLDTGVALYFPGPASFTGEDVLELQGHGGSVVSELVVGAVLGCGARLARPGEFSERAFLNGKMDLAQAEAVADLISAATSTAARSALRSLRGEFSMRIQGLRAALIELRTHIEAGLDFADEDINPLFGATLLPQAEHLAGQFADLLRATRCGAQLGEGVHVVLIGPPNAGKSSLLNRLAQIDKAIVSPVPGTTRDLVEAQIDIAGVPVHLTDTAGLREAQNEVETEGVRRAESAVERCDLILLIGDVMDLAAADAVHRKLTADSPVIHVLNKIDLCEDEVPADQYPDSVLISAKTGAGIEELRERIRSCCGVPAETDGSFTARQRHIDALERALRHLSSAGQHITATTPELAAEELRLAQECLNEITGEFTSDDLLGSIFGSFCIGK